MTVAAAGHDSSREVAEGWQRDGGSSDTPKDKPTSTDQAASFGSSSRLMAAAGHDSSGEVAEGWQRDGRGMAEGWQRYSRGYGRGIAEG